MATGKYWVYEVHEDRYSLSEAPTSSTYFVKETIGELLSTAQDTKTLKLIRYKRSRSTDSWKADSIWTIQQQPDKIIRTENNIAFVNLIFPIGSNTSWNRNEYNTRPVSLSGYEKVGQDYVLNEKRYANTILVTDSENDSTAISLNRQLAAYAYQTGLIYREQTALAYCQSSAACIGKGEITNGYRRTWTLLNAGTE